MDRRRDKFQLDVKHSSMHTRIVTSSQGYTKEIIAGLRRRLAARHDSDLAMVKVFAAYQSSATKLFCFRSSAVVPESLHSTELAELTFPCQASCKYSYQTLSTTRIFGHVVSCKPRLSSGPILVLLL